MTVLYEKVFNARLLSQQDKLKVDIKMWKLLRGEGEKMLPATIEICGNREERCLVE